MKFIKRFKSLNESVEIEEDIDILNDLRDIFLNIEDEFGTDLKFSFAHYDQKASNPGGSPGQYIYYNPDGEEYHREKYNKITFLPILDLFLVITNGEIFTIDSLLYFQNLFFQNIKRAKDQLGIKVNTSRTGDGFGCLFQVFEKPDHNDYHSSYFNLILDPYDEYKFVGIGNQNDGGLDLDKWVVDKFYVRNDGGKWRSNKVEIKFTLFLESPKRTRYI